MTRRRTPGGGCGPARSWTALLLASVLGLGGCLSEESGTTVLFTALSRATDVGKGSSPRPPDREPRIFMTDIGYQVNLSQGYFVVSAVEILPTTRIRATSPISAFESFLIPEAVAHTVGSPTRLGAPNVVDLLAADVTPRELGRIEPPPGIYGTLRITWGPADDDAGYLPPDFDMIDHALRLMGRAVKGADTLDFIISDAGIDSVDVDFSPAAAAAAPSGVDRSRLVLGAGEQASVGIGIDCDTWFDGVDFGTMSSEDRHARVMTNIRASLGYRPTDAARAYATAGRPTAP